MCLQDIFNSEIAYIVLTSDSYEHIKVVKMNINKDFFGWDIRCILLRLCVYVHKISIILNDLLLKTKRLNLLTAILFA